MSSITAAAVASFLASVGINLNINPSTEGSVVSKLAYVGINQVRVQAPTSGSAAQSFAAIGSAGIKFDMITTTWDLPITQAMLNTMFSYIDVDAAYVQSIEGPNEVQNDPDTYNGQSGAAAFQALQQTLYAMVQSDSNLSNSSTQTPVLSYSNTPGPTPAGYTSPLNATDYASVHAYGQPAVLPWEVIQPTLQVSSIAPGKPVVLTETGLSTVNTSQGAPEMQQAVYDLDALFDGFLLGATRTYLFNLVDFNSGAGDTNFSGWYGLFATDGAIKLTGQAMHNLTTILADPGGSAGQPTDQLGFTLNGLPANSHSLLLEKSSGVFDIIVWTENNSLYNAQTHTLSLAPITPWTLSFDNGAQNVTVYDPLWSRFPTQVAFGQTVMPMTLAGHPIIIEVSNP